MGAETCTESGGHDAFACWEVRGTHGADEDGHRYGWSFWCSNLMDGVVTAKIMVDRTQESEGLFLG